MKNNWRTLQTVLTVFIRIFIALCKNGLVMRMKAFISRPFPAAVQLNKKETGRVLCRSMAAAFQRVV